MKKEIKMCVGCGLCETVFSGNAHMMLNDEGFMRPNFSSKYDKMILNSICPLNTHSNEYSADIWGSFQSVFLGSSTDIIVRKDASSGGIITQILLYLLETGRVDAVIQIGASKTDPLKNELFISQTKEEVIHCCGSRYSPSAPLFRIDEILKGEKVFAFVGKPCDVRALKSYIKENPQLNEKIYCALSFFCAGVPSYKGTDKLINQLGFAKEDVTHFRYRGNGWPGFAEAKINTGESRKMTYNDSWGRILGRQVQTYCRWCADGIGEFADIACGDAWYLDKNNQPDFGEREGRNVIFARSNLGAEILSDMNAKSKITLDDFNRRIDTLRYMQPYQYHRRANMLGKIIALKLLFIKTPRYRLKILFRWSLYSTFGTQIKVFTGTILRKKHGKL